MGFQELLAKFILLHCESFFSVALQCSSFVVTWIVQIRLICILMRKKVLNSIIVSFFIFPRRIFCNSFQSFNFLSIFFSTEAFDCIDLNTKWYQYQWPRVHPHLPPLRLSSVASLARWPYFYYNAPLLRHKEHKSHVQPL